MSTDRELLVLAAKAAGIKINKSSTGGGGHGNTGFDAMGNAVLDWHNFKAWNPLNNDGDALRLAVKLRLYIVFHHESVNNDAVSVLRGTEEWAEELGDDANAATRRAIVRAAAEIGERMS